MRMVKTARWWQWINNGWVRLSLVDGQTLRWSESHATDEGWSEECQEWSREGELIYRRGHCAGRDCDGLLVQSFNCVTTVEQLRANEPHEDSIHELPPGAMLPEWTKLNASVFDENAVAAGY